MKISPAIILGELKARNVRRTLAIYLSSALTTVGIVKLSTEVYNLSATIFTVAVVFLTCGVATAFLVAWYHGSQGSQKIQKREYLLHALVLLTAVFLSLRVTDSQKHIHVAADLRTIAVLPFKNLSDDKQDEYFSIGITDDILTQLSKINDLRVISRTSVMKYKDTEKTIREIGGELGAATILEGSVRRAGNRVRIVSQLINTQTDEHLWAETYDREMRDIFAIQSEVAQRIATELKAKLSSDERARIDKKPTDNIEAYAYYLRGREEYYRYVKESNEQAIELFKRALALDSAYALAYAGLADAYAQRYQRFDFGHEWVDSAVTLSKKAIALDPSIAEPYKALGLAYTQRGWYTKGLEQYYKAVALNPNFASVVANIGQVNLWLGRFDEAYPWITKGIALTPGRASYYHTLALTYMRLALDSAAKHWFKRAMELQPSFTYTYGDLGYLYMVEGDFQRARQIVGEALAKNPDDTYLLNAAGDVELFARDFTKAKEYYEKSLALSPPEEGPSTQMAFILWTMKKRTEASKVFDQSIELSVKGIQEGNEDEVFRYDQARIFAIRGDTTEALNWLQQAIDISRRNYRWIQLDPMLDSIKNTSRFQQMIERLKAQVDDMRRKVVDYETSTIHVNEP
jgi:eukaryotic-like serine/threonine-protein kinase